MLPTKVGANMLACKAKLYTMGIKKKWTSADGQRTSNSWGICAQGDAQRRLRDGWPVPFTTWKAVLVVLLVLSSIEVLMDQRPCFRNALANRMSS